MKRIVEIAVGMLMLVGVISIGYGIFHQGEELASQTSERIANEIAERKEWSLTQYEGLGASGVDVIKYIKTNIDQVDKIKVVTEGKTFYASVDQFDKYRVSSSEYYINPLKTFTVETVRNKNKVITEVVISVKTEH